MAILTLATLVLAQAYGPIGAYDASPLALGRGLDRDKPLKGFSYPVDMTASKREMLDGGAPTVSISTRQVSSYQELLRELKIDVKASARAMFFSAGAEFHLHEKDAFSDGSITWVSSAYQDFGREGFREVELTDKAKSLIGKPEFESAYGTEFVDSVRKTAMVAAVFTLRNVNTSHYQSIQARITASANFLAGGGKLDASYSKMIQEFTKLGVLSCSFYARGGPGIQQVSKIISTSDVEVFKTAVEGYIAGVTKDNAVPTEFSTRDYVEWKGTAPKEVPSAREVALENSYYAFLDARDRLDYCKKTLSQIDAGADIFTDTEVQQLKDAKKEAEERKAAIATACDKWRTGDVEGGAGLWEDLKKNVPRLTIRLGGDFRKEINVGASNSIGNLHYHIDNIFSGGETGPIIEGKWYSQAQGVYGVVPSGDFSEIEVWRDGAFQRKEPLFTGSGGKKYFVINMNSYYPNPSSYAGFQLKLSSHGTEVFSRDLRDADKGSVLWPQI